MNDGAEPLFDYSDWQTQRDVRRCHIDDALSHGRWQLAQTLLAEQSRQDERLRRWLDQRIVSEMAR